MVYGMTARYYQGADPKHTWKVWDEFGIQDAQMIGYWVPGCPVKANHEGTLATLYLKKRKALMSIAGWAKEAVDCRLEIDWSALWIDPYKARLSAQNTPAFQKEARFDPSAEIPIEPGPGWLLLLEEEAS
jgi:hypothetical protein